MSKITYYKVDNDKMTVTFVVEKLTDSEVKAVKNYIAFGYKPNAVTIKQFLPNKENLYTKDNIIKFLNSKGKDGVSEFENKMKEKNKNGKNKGFVYALKWFRSNYEKEFLEFINKIKEN